LLEGFSAKILLSAGPWGLLILVVTVVLLGLMTERIVPRKTVEKNYKILNDQLERAEKRADKWEETAATWQATAHEAVANREENQEQGRTLIQMLASVPRGTSGRRGGN
jgi:hypothetical protein